MSLLLVALILQNIELWLFVFAFVTATGTSISVSRIYLQRSTSPLSFCSLKRYFRKKIFSFKKSQKTKWEPLDDCEAISVDFLLKKSIERTMQCKKPHYFNTKTKNYLPVIVPKKLTRQTKLSGNPHVQRRIFIRIILTTFHSSKMTEISCGLVDNFQYATER